MSGPVYFGLLVEKWPPRSLDAVKEALAEVIVAGWSSSPPDAFELRVFAHEGSAWLDVDDLGSLPEKYPTRDHAPLAAAVAKASGSPVWLYEYLDAASFGITARRFTKSGKESELQGVGEDTHPPASLKKKGFDFVTWAQDEVSKAIRKHVKWPAELLRTTPEDFDGPEITAEVESELHALAPFVKALRAHAHPPKPEAAAPKSAGGDVREALAVARAEGKLLGDFLRQVEPTLEAKDLDTFLDLTDADDLGGIVEGTMKGFEGLAIAFARAPLKDINLHMDPKRWGPVLALQKREGKPKDLDEVRDVVAMTRVLVSERVFSGLEELVRKLEQGSATDDELFNLGAQMKFSRTLVHLTYMALMYADEKFEG